MSIHVRFHESIDVEHVNRCRINEDSRSLGSIHLPSSCTFTPFTWTALHDPTVSLSILYIHKYILHEFTCTHLVKIWSPETEVVSVSLPHRHTTLTDHFIWTWITAGSVGNRGWIRHGALIVFPLNSSKPSPL